MLVIREKTQEEFLHRYIMLFSAMFFKESNWLTEKERDFLVKLILFRHSSTDDEMKYFRDKTTFKGKSYYGYMDKLQTKGWVKGNAIHPNFDFSNRPIPNEIPFTFKLCGEKN
jgi:hypothetical protein